MTWDLVLQILGSSVLAAFIAFGLELGRSYSKEISEHNKNILSIYKELKTLRDNLEDEDLRRNVDIWNMEVLLPTANINNLLPRIAGNISSETLAYLQQIRQNLYDKKRILSVRSYLDEILEQVNFALEELRKETKGIRKPKLK